MKKKKRNQNFLRKIKMIKVLSLKEPFATLIKAGIKKVETRSWQTSYRGELYIHASISRSTINEKNTEFQKLIKDLEYQPSYIICKCNLIDCIYMTKEYIENIKKTNYQEYLCGDYKEGRYAWILENIEPLSIPIKAKGQLNIWNFYSINEIMTLMDNIEYGWLDQNNNQHNLIDNTYQDNYILETPQEVMKNKIGVCWDQVELERYYLRTHDLNIKTYFLVYYDNDKCPTHTFLTYEKDNKYYWMEHAWMKFKGIHEYSSKKELLTDVKNKFIINELKNHCTLENLILYEYKKTKYHISTQEFFKHCESGQQIEIEKE